MLASWRGKKVGLKNLIGVLSHAGRSTGGKNFPSPPDCVGPFDVSSRARRQDLHESGLILSGGTASGRSGAMMSLVRKANPDYVLTSDASGSWGCGAFVGPNWFQVKWSGPITECHITVKEQALACMLQLAVCRGSPIIRVMCDNEAGVAILNHNHNHNWLYSKARTCETKKSTRD